MNDTDRTPLPAARAGACGGDCATCPCRPAEPRPRAGTALARLADVFPRPTLLLPSPG